MTKEEILKKQRELNKEWYELSIRWVNNGYTRSKADKKREWEIIRENQNLQRELDKLDGKIYNNEVWITNFSGESYESLKAARMDLINAIKDLPGVEVGEEKSGVVGVSVYTEHKIYHYTIHAHYRVEYYNPHMEKNIFGVEETVCDTRQIYQAICEPCGNPNWEWRY